MPLRKNSAQPYFPDPYMPAPRDCGGAYCYPIALGDDIHQQWYQEPCGGNEIEDPDFSSVTYGANLVTNGTFATDLTGWTTTGWIWDTGQAEGPVTTNPNHLTQSVAITPATFYRLTLDVSGLSPGDELRVYIGSAASWYTITTNGSYDEIIKSSADNTNLVFVAGYTNLANVLIDNVTLGTATFGDWDLGGTWTVQAGGGRACSDGTSNGTLIEDVTDYIEANAYYRLKFTVSSYVSGSFVPWVSDVDGDAVLADGDYTIYLTPTVTGVVSFVPTSFVGCIENLELVKLRNDYLFEVIDGDGNRYDISEYIEYWEDKVTLNSPVFDLLELSYGCYTIEVTDRCLVEGIELVTNGEFTAGYTNWTRNNGFDQYNLNGGVMELIFEPLENGNILTNGDFSSGGAGWTATNWTIAAGATHTPGNTSPLSRSVTIGTPAVAPNVRVSWVQLTISGRTAGSITVTLSDLTSASYNTNEVITFPLIPTVGGVVTISINPTSDFDGTVDDIQVYQSLKPWSAFVQLRNDPNVDYVFGNYALEYDLVSNSTVGGFGGMAIGIAGQTQSLTYDSTVATQTRSITDYTPGQQFTYIQARFRIGNNYYPGRIGVDNVSAVRVEPFEATYTSECMRYDLEHENTYILSAYSDQEAYGFEFANSGFLLQMRAEVRGFHPFVSKERLVASSGTGAQWLTYASGITKYNFVTDFMPVSAHLAFSAMLDMDHFTVGTSAADAIEYVAEAEDYQPQWRGEGDSNLAPIIVTLTPAEGGIKFNRHV
jgi:hypothetical protein